MENLPTSRNQHWEYLILLLFLFLVVPIIFGANDETVLFQNQSVCACAIVINEKEPTDTLIFQLEVDMLISLLCETESIRKMPTKEILESLDNLTPFIICEETFEEIKKQDWGLQPSSRLDSIYGADGINGVITDCFFSVDDVLYQKQLFNKEEHPVIWTDFIWEMRSGDHYFYADRNYVIFLLQKHHLYVKYDVFLNTILLSNVDLVVDTIEYELR